MKKTYYETIIRSLLCSLCLFICTACHEEAPDTKPEQLHIVLASYPEYNWMCQIVGEESSNVHLKLLMDTGVDVHSFEPSVKDVLELSQADLVVFNGGTSYSWLEKILNEKRSLLNLMDALGSKVKLMEGIACHHEHDHEHKHSIHEYDEHIWLSLRHAITLTQAMADELSHLDAEHAERYQANAQAYISKLQALDAKYAALFKISPRDTIIVADRFPLLYLVSDYNLKHVAAFQACSAETEASFETVLHLTNTIKELRPPALIILEGSSHKLAQTLLENSQHSPCEILEINAFHTLPQEGDYASIMEKNLQQIQKALAP